MSLSDFKNCDVRYAYDKESKVYSVKVNFKGKPLILTLRVGKDLMDMTLTDSDGNEVEYLGQMKKQLAYRLHSQLASQYH